MTLVILIVIKKNIWMLTSNKINNFEFLNYETLSNNKD